MPIPPRYTVRPEVDLEEIREELTELLNLVKSGQIWQEPEFSEVAPELRRLNDIAFSGDGEPTTYAHFDQAVEVAIEAREAVGYQLDEVKIVLITNATVLQRPAVQRGLELLRENNGEIWAKLDAGTAEYYDTVDKTNVPFERVLNNLEVTSQTGPINIQTCMMRLHEEGPSQDEIEAYCVRLNELKEAGGQLSLVQLYTVARRPPNDWVTSLPVSELDRIAAIIRQRTGLPVEIFG